MMNISLIHSMNTITQILLHHPLLKVGSRLGTNCLEPDSEIHVNAFTEAFLKIFYQRGGNL